MPHQTGVLIENLAIFDKYLVISEKENAQSRIKIINQATQKSHFLQLKEQLLFHLFL